MLRSFARVRRNRVLIACFLRARCCQGSGSARGRGGGMLYR